MRVWVFIFFYYDLCVVGLEFIMWVSLLLNILKFIVEDVGCIDNWRFLEEGFSSGYYYCLVLEGFWIYEYEC